MERFFVVYFHIITPVVNFSTAPLTNSHPVVKLTSGLRDNSRPANHNCIIMCEMLSLLNHSAMLSVKLNGLWGSIVTVVQSMVH